MMLHKMNLTLVLTVRSFHSLGYRNSTLINLLRFNIYYRGCFDASYEKPTVVGSLLFNQTFQCF